MSSLVAQGGVPSTSPMTDDLSQIEDFAKAAEPLDPTLQRPFAAPDAVVAGDLYCVKCAGRRRMILARVSWPAPPGLVRSGDQPPRFAVVRAVRACSR